jgi:peptide/nickel transport system substrate-binding protein
VARPDLARASSRRLRFVPQADLAVLDPIWTTAYVTRHHALMVFDTLFGVDAEFKAQPQMVGGVEQSEEGKTWALSLRESLRFHDGTPVLARDCVASIARWAQRDSFGSALMAATNELSARDDRTMVFRLRRPFPLLPDALGKLGSNICAIMPERLALTAATTQVTEMVGSGPFRFLAKDRVSGSHVAYERFSDYVPREGGTPEWTAGPKVAHFDRIDWTVMPDPATASAALQNGEVDWLEQPSFDLLPVLKKSRRVVVEQVDPTGYTSLMRFNFLHPPFDNPAIRRAVLGAVDQSDYMTAVAGEDRTLWKDGVGYFPPGSPMQNDVGMSELRGPRDLDEVRSEIAAAGYKGERIVVMVATDFPVMNALGQVGADMLGRCGFNVDLQATDWGSVVQRRSSRKPAAEGGWNVFFTASSGLEQYFPVSNMALRGNGAEAWAGWPTLPKLEALRTAWIEAPDLMSQKRIAQELQAEAFRTVPYVPLGEYLQPTAHTPRLTGLLKGATIFWNAKLND